MSWFGNLIGDILDPIGLFHTTSSQQKTDNQWEANYNLQLRALQDQENAFTYQQQYDKWAQNFAESQDAFSREAFNKQFQLSSSPVSSVVKDGASVGVNPMAALGQNAGSASYSSSGVPSSNTGNGFGASPVSPINNMGSIISALGSVDSASIGASQAERLESRSS